MVLYTCKELKQMSNKNKKSNNDWLKQALLDLIIGVILLLIEKLLNGAVALNGSPLLIFKGKNPATKPDFFDQKLGARLRKTWLLV